VLDVTVCSPFGEYVGVDVDSYRGMDETSRWLESRERKAPRYDSLEACGGSFAGADESCGVLAAVFTNVWTGDVCEADGIGAASPLSVGWNGDAPWFACNHAARVEWSTGHLSAAGAAGAGWLEEVKGHMMGDGGQADGSKTMKSCEDMNLVKL
jgi:hypothetical protein